MQKQVGIKAIRKKHYQKPVPVYCVNVEPNHEIIVNDGIVTKQSANFGMLFGMSGFKFATQTIMTEWSTDQVREYFDSEDNADDCAHYYTKFIDMLRRGTFNQGTDVAWTDQIDKDDLDDAYRENFLTGIQNKEYVAKCWAVASSLRKKFYNTYAGLYQWIQSQPELAEKYGYIQSPFGMIRRLPQLTHIGKHFLVGEVKTLQNISINAPVQNIEISMFALLMQHVHEYMNNKNMKSRLGLTVHDSIVLYLHKDEVDEVIDVCRKFFEQDWDEMYGIPVKIEGNVADYYGKGEIWGEGYEV